MKRIELTGKYAAGEHRYALVDDADFEGLNRWRWKAKWNGAGNYVYAVRNTKVDGRNITLRMHRVILGLDPGDPTDVDHINQKSLDNRRQNLRLASRKENLANRRWRTLVRNCTSCGVEFAATVNKLQASARCAACRSAHKRRKQSEEWRQTYLLLHCAQCNAGMTGVMRRKRYCSNACRKRAKRQPRRPSPTERIIAEISVAPGTARDIAVRVGCHESDARRILASLVRDGSLTHAGKSTGDKGWASTVYAARSSQIS